MKDIKHKIEHFYLMHREYILGAAVGFILGAIIFWLGAALYLIERIVRKLYAKIWFLRITLTTNLKRKKNVRYIKRRNKNS